MSLLLMRIIETSLPGVLVDSGDIWDACQLYSMERVLWWLIAGTKGGVNRARMINALRDRPYNANQLSEVLELDYKTIRHHLKVLSENGVVTSTGDGYGAMYFLSPAMDANYALFEEIWEKIGNKFKVRRR